MINTRSFTTVFHAATVALAIFFIGTVGRADALGNWSGDGYVYDNIAHGFECPQVDMKFAIKKNRLVFEQSGDCVDFSLWLTGELGVKGADLYDGKTKVGTITDSQIEFQGYQLGESSRYNLKATVGANGKMDFADSIHYFSGKIDSLEATLLRQQ